MRSCFLLVFVFLLGGMGLPATATPSHGTLQLRALDPHGERVRNALLTLFTRDNRVRLTGVTNAAGEFVFEAVAPGEYVVHADAAGFLRSAARTLVVTDRQTVILELRLQPAESLDQVVVTASGTAQSTDEISKAITLIQDTEIDLRNELAIPDALVSVPGVRVQSLGGTGAFTSIKMRGLRTEDTAVLLDGFRLRDAAATQGDASGLLEGLIVTNLDRLEILRGSGSSLYGSNAIGGVVNVVTSEGGGPARGSLLLEGGSRGSFRGRARVAGGFNADRVTYSLGLARLDVAEGVDGDDKARNTSVQGQVRFQPTPTSRLSARIYGVDAALNVNESPQVVGMVPATGIIDATPLPDSQLERFERGVPVDQLDAGASTFIPAANDPDNRREMQFLSSAVSFEQRALGRFGYSLAYHGLFSRRTFEDGPLGVGFEPSVATKSEFDGNVHTLHASADLQLGRHHLITAGYEFEKETYFNASFPEDAADNSTVDVSQSSNTLFVQDQVRLAGGSVQISGAFRAQFFSFGAPDFSPSDSAPYAGFAAEAPPSAYTGDGSVAWFIGRSQTKLRGHVGNGYRAPSLYERFGTFFDVFGYSTFGDPRLEPERSLGFDVGADQHFFGRRVGVSGTFFQTRLHRIIVFDFSGAIDPATDPFGRYGGYRSVDGGTAEGVELSLAAVPTDSLHLAVTYTYTNTEAPASADRELTQAYVIPRHQFSLVATQFFGPNFYANFVLSASDRYYAPLFDPLTFASRTYRFDGIVNANLGAAYRWRMSHGGGVRFFAQVRNLFDRDNYESGYRTEGRKAIGGAAYEF